MKGTDIFPGKHLKAEDLGTAQPVVTIEHVDTTDFQDGSRKPVVHFVGKDKGLVLNKTNWNALVDITGQDDSDYWPGHKVKLVVARVDYQGKRVPAIRVEPAGTATVPPSRLPHPPAEPLTDDEIPF